MTRLCPCGRHFRHDEPFQARFLSLDQRVEMTCATTKADTHVHYEQGRRWASVTVRLPLWVADGVAAITRRFV